MKEKIYTENYYYIVLNAFFLLVDIFSCCTLCSEHKQNRAVHIQFYVSVHANHRTSRNGHLETALF
jgi:hypothetical protein